MPIYIWRLHSETLKARQFMSIKYMCILFLYEKYQDVMSNLRNDGIQSVGLRSRCAQQQHMPHAWRNSWNNWWKRNLRGRSCFHTPRLLSVTPLVMLGSVEGQPKKQLDPHRKDNRSTRSGERLTSLTDLRSDASYDFDECLCEMYQV